MAAKARLPKVGDNVAGFEIIGVLDEGEYSSRFEAVQLDLGFRVVVKMIAPIVVERSPDVAARFLREIELVKRLDHPNIVRMYDHGQTDEGLLWMATELVEGKPLDKVLGEHGPIDGRRSKNIMLQVLAGLAEAHSQGIIHRRVEPTNISLMDEGAEKDIVKLADFGLAKAIGLRNDPAIKDITGSLSSAPLMPHFSAPEGLKLEEVGAYSDVYSAGLVLFEMLTGTPAVDADNIIEAFDKQLSEPLDVPAWLADSPFGPVLAKATTKNAADRYPSAEEFYAALENVEPAGLKVPASASAQPASNPGSRTLEPAKRPTLRGAHGTTQTSMSDLKEKLLKGKTNPARQRPQPLAQSTGGALTPGRARPPAPSLLATKSSARPAQPGRANPGVVAVAPSPVKADAANQANGSSSRPLPPSAEIGKSEPGQAKPEGAGAPKVSPRGTSPISARGSAPAAEVPVSSDEAASASSTARSQPSPTKVEAPKPIAAPLASSEPQAGRGEALVGLPDFDQPEGGNATTVVALPPEDIIAKESRAQTVGGSEDATTLAEQVHEIAAPLAGEHVVFDANAAVPTDASEPAVAAVAAATVGTNDAALDLSDGATGFDAEPDYHVPQRRKPIGMILALIVVLGLAGGLVWYFMQPSGTPDKGDSEKAAKTPDSDESGTGAAAEEDPALDEQEAAANAGAEGGDEAAPGDDGEYDFVGEETDPGNGGETVTAAEGPTKVSWSIVSMPEGASVVTDGAQSTPICAATPCTVELDPSEAEIAVRFELDGHEPLVAKLTPNDDGSLEIELKPVKTGSANPDEDKAKLKKERRRHRSQRKGKKGTDPFSAKSFD